MNFIIRYYQEYEKYSLYDGTRFYHVKDDNLVIYSGIYNYFSSVLYTIKMIFESFQNIKSITVVE